MPDETRAARPSEALDETALAAYLREALPRQPAFVARHGRHPLTGPIAVRQFAGGHSNLTYLVTIAAAQDRDGARAIELVLRRPPLGPVAPRAHDMAREFRWLAALHPRFPLAPQPYLLAEEPAVFYVMERRDGLVIRDDEPPGVRDHPDVRRRIGEAVVDTLADLHAVDARAGPIAALGKPDGFVRRQIAGWKDRWQRSKTIDLDEMDAVAAWLAGRVPPDGGRVSVVHGDYKLDNVMLDAADPTRVAAVLDWEMCALGDPLVDVGIFLGYWLPTPDGGGRDALSTVTDRPGWPTRRAVLDRYAARTGFDVSGVGFFEAFAVFKLAVVIQQIYVRYVRGQTDDARFAALGGRVQRLARRAAQLAHDLG